jgi:hypothetical protein
MNSSRGRLQIPLAAYFAERLVIDESIDRAEWTAGSAIYDDYLAWCQDVGNEPLSKIKLGRELRDRLGANRDECRRHDGLDYPVRLRRVQAPQGMQ